MRITGAPALGILGGLAVGFFGILPVLGFKVPEVHYHRQVTAQKPVLPDIERIEVATEETSPVCNVGADSLYQQGLDPEKAISSALKYKVELLDRGKQTLLAIPDYMATMQKQEVVHGVLLDEQTISVKCRHQPFSVYLAWHTGMPGREVLYIEGENNGHMVAHDGGWKARIPALTLPTDCMIAMRDARYPVTTAGILGLIDIMRGIHQDDLDRSSAASCEVDKHRQFDGRPCTMFTIKYKSPSDSAVYRKSITLVDHEWSLPLHTRHFEWPGSETVIDEQQLDELTLIECYSFTEINFNANLTDHDFDRKNPEYHFR